MNTTTIPLLRDALIQYFPLTMLDESPYSDPNNDWINRYRLADFIVRGAVPAIFRVDRMSMTAVTLENREIIRNEVTLRRGLEILDMLAPTIYDGAIKFKVNAAADVVSAILHDRPGVLCERLVVFYGQMPPDQLERFAEVLRSMS